jgi:hypothetical protein
MFCQQNFDDVLEWDDFVQEHLDSRLLFVSNLISAWEANGAKVSIIPIFPEFNLWSRFRDLLGLPYGMDSPYSRTRTRITDPLVESLYNSKMTNDVKKYVGANDYWTGKIPISFIGRTLTDVNMICRPLFEYAKRITVNQLLDEGVLSVGASDGLRRYCAEWLNDFATVIKSERFDGGQASQLGDALRRYSESDHRKVFVPVNGFRQLLPTDGDWEVLVRVVSASISLRYQAMSSSNEI